MSARVRGAVVAGTSERAGRGGEAIGFFVVWGRTVLAVLLFNVKRKEVFQICFSFVRE